MSTEPVPQLPDVDFSEHELVTFIGAADAIEARNHASRLLWIAQLARRSGRAGELATADGRGGPGVDARALTDPVLAGVREDFLSELALTCGCSESQASDLLREALLATSMLA